LLYNYFITGNIKAKNKIEVMYKKSLEWNEKYDFERGFWTERNQAAALNIAISYWEITQNKGALKRIKDIIKATVDMTFNPLGEWQLKGCPQHTYRAHEGEHGEFPVCSPWMLALLGDALWRYYQLTEDKSAAALIDTFGDFILNYGIYYGSHKKLTRTVLPKYLSAVNSPEFDMTNQWTDSLHLCDVAGLIGKSVYIKDKYQRPDLLLTELFSVFTKQCKKNLRGHAKLSDSFWRLKTPRSFTWRYSSTSDLPWLFEKFIQETQ